MKQLSLKLSFFGVIITLSMMLGSWSGGPVVECKNDSLAIIRVIRPVNGLFKVRPAVFISTGFGKIEVVKMSDVDYGNDDRVIRQTLLDFMSNGYALQTTTETAEFGTKLNTYYLKKKVI